jgi:tRNA threonylcarbamoyladenosine biosynthesis protein TsaE
MNQPILWKAEQDCSESALSILAKEFVREIQRQDRIILKGPMGAGKTTFARALLMALDVKQPAQGSPTFSIAHEYESFRGEVIHIDLFRLKSEVEIEEAGISSYFWERSSVVIVEWLSKWPKFEQEVLLKQVERRNWRVSLSFDLEKLQAKRRDIRIELL